MYCCDKSEVVPKKSSAGKKIIGIAALAGVTIAAAQFVKRVYAAKKEDAKRGNTYRDVKEYYNVFDGEQISVDGEEPKSMKLTTIFGGIQIDLSKAVFKEDISLEALTVFGGVELTVPNGVNVEVNCSVFAGGVNNTTEYQSGLPTIFISGKTFFGGINIKIED